MESDERKAIGPDRVSGYILKGCRREMSEPIHDVIQCSLKTGKVPKEWKRADIMPIYKHGNKEEPLNYRPVSLTIIIICKICEKEETMDRRLTKENKLYEIDNLDSEQEGHMS